MASSSSSAGTCVAGGDSASDGAQQQPQSNSSEAYSSHPQSPPSVGLDPPPLLAEESRMAMTDGQNRRRSDVTLDLDDGGYNDDDDDDDDGDNDDEIEELGGNNMEEDDDDCIEEKPRLNVAGGVGAVPSNATNQQLLSKQPMLMRDASGAMRSSIHQESNGIIPGTRKRISSMSSSLGYGEKRTATKVCRVCGDKAYSYNFNVITCESCKAFFRRNANKEKEIRCPFNDQCDINLVSRRFCQRCRLQKCFKVGMKKEWIMSEEARAEKKQRVMDNRERRHFDQRFVHPKHLSPHQGFVTPSTQHSPVTPGTPNIQHNHMSASLPVQSSTPNASRRESMESLPSPNALLAAGFRPPSLAVPTVAQHEAMFAHRSTAPTPAATFTSFNQQQTAALAVGRVPMSPQHGHIRVAAQAQMQQAQMQQAQLQQAQLQQAQLQQAQLQQAQLQQAQLQQAQLQQRLQQQQQLPPVQVQVAPPPPSVVQPSPGDDNFAGGLVTIPRHLLVKLVEGQQHQPPPRALSADQQCGRCVCTCLCGAYPPGTVVTDAIIAKLLSTSAHERAVTQQDTVNLNLIRSAQLLHSSTAAANAVAAAATASPLQWFGTQQGPFTVASQLPVVMNDKLGLDDCRNGPAVGSKVSPQGIISVPPTTVVSEVTPPIGAPSLFEEAVGRVSPWDKDCQPLSEDDQERMVEILRANEVWSEPLDPNTKDGAQHTKGDPNKVDMVNMADGAIRRLIKMTKRMDGFRNIEHRDQIQLLKCSCMEYLILRGAMAYDPSKNAWVGPTQKAGYTVRMEAMKETQNNMFESSIRFYATFKEEWRTNEKVMLVLGAIVVFNPDCPGLKFRDAVRAEHNVYKRILKRILHEICGHDARRTLTEYEGLMDRLADLKVLNDRAQKMLMEVSPTDMEPLLLEMFDR
uniref:Nuclear hormone receptor HR96 n=1 Tax=Plectus sambesii TaxID=2011161 RepID=A0A914V3X3_9BILA